jgi:SAM-dependent methyltransferase
VANTAGRVTLGELLARIEGAACVLTNDTGPMHMSIALQRPTACLFGPANPEHYGQDLPFVDIFYAQVFCSPCLYEADEPPCDENNLCMQRIEPAAVVEAVQHLARTGVPRRKRQREPFLNALPILAETPDGSPLGVVVRASTKPSGEGEAVRCIACSAPMVPRFVDAVAGHWRCPCCGLESIWPQPDDRSLSAIYGERYFSHYKSTIDPQLTRSMKRATFDRQLRLLASTGPFPNKRRLLDCGAATGILAERAKEQGWDAFAIEVSEFGADACAKLLGPDHIYRGEVQSAFFAANPENRFEVITMCDFIEHVRDPREVLRWARERLMPGGVLLLTTPEVGGISWRVMGRHWFHYVPEHLWFLNSQSIRMLLNESGFEDAAVAPLRKTVTVEYALAYYHRSSSDSRIFSPVARLLKSLLPAFIRRQSFRFYLGEMVVTARASVEETSRATDYSPERTDQFSREHAGGKAV